MGTGWRRAFCTSIRGDPEAAEPAVAPDSPAPKTCSRLGFFSSSSGGGSNPSTPRLRCRTTTPPPPPEVQDGPRLQCKTTRTTPSNSTPSSPRSPSRLSNIFKSGLRLSRNSRCGVCMEGVKAGQGRAIFTAECSHAFHFPCIASHVKKTSSLVCPVCSSQWRDPPLLTLHKSLLLSSSSSSHRHEPKSMPSTPTKSIEPKPESTPKKAYDDDEPLLSTSHGGPTRFNPIFEAEDEENDDGDDDEIGEFQGFFVNPSSSSSSCPPVNNAGVEVRMSSEAAVVSISRYHETHIVALRVKAPAAAAAAVMLEPRRRAAIDLVTVLDVSATMSGAKLHMLKRAMRLLVASLGPADRLCVVAFSGAAKRLLPLRRMSPAGKRSARQIVDRLACSGRGGGAAAGVSSEALRKAARVLEDRRHRNPVASIVLLSDGQEDQSSAKANRSRSSSTSRSRPTTPSSTRFAHLEIPVHASGFGDGKNKKGEPAEDAFARCVGGLLSVVAQDVRLQIGFAPGLPAAGEITAIYSCGGRPALVGAGGASSSVRIGDLYAEEERELLVEMRVLKSSSAGGDQRLMSSRCCFKDPATQELRHCRDRALVLPTARAVRSSDPKIERLRNLFVATRATAESRRLVERGDSAMALHLLSSARSLLMQSTSTSADENLRVVEAEMAELKWRRQQQSAAQSRRTTETAAAETVGGAEALTPTSAWRAAERLAKVAIMRKSMNRVSDLHGFENARF
ncbi:hypothetical protein QJS10_CPB13g00310 [Acorus calamus]|uniref:Uncharacterized protein n=1 Tax=Acorus calamus TaxID=4465 RepID=A0AAV9DFI1_ACOCL|nr:hypothetical protein QJS10_CPB13g00310 [Acorus calamus]